VAICGILLMNIPFFARSFWADNPQVYGETAQPLNMFWWSFINFFMEGSMRGLFSVLFGAGALLLLGRLEQRHQSLKPADVYYRRLIWLLIFGLINGYVFIWPGDILYHYAITGMFLFPFRNASKKLLLWLVAAFVVITMVSEFVGKRNMYAMQEKGINAMNLQKAGKTLSEDQKADLEKWNGFNEERKPENLRKKADKETKTISTGSYGDVWESFTKWTTKLESSKFHGGMFFDIIIFFLLGMYLFKSGILTGQKSWQFYAVLLVAGYTVGLGSGWWAHHAVLKANFDPFAFWNYYGLPVRIYQIHRVGTVLGHMSLIILMYKSGFFKWLLTPFARMGQMAFSNYLLQSIICSLIFYGYGLGLFGKFQRYEIYYFWAGICLFEMLLSVVWLRLFKFGPFEWAWRSLTYWQKQPMRTGNPRVPDLE
jgi:uncharacterized protein